MKPYRVLIHPDAEVELDEAYRHIAEDAPERIEADTVTILHIRHGARLPVGEPHRLGLGGGSDDEE